MIKFNCPKCDGIISADDDQTGESAECPGCGNVCIVPTPWGETPVQAIAPEPEPQPEPSAPAPETEPQPAPAGQPASADEVRKWTTWCHLSALAGYVIPGFGCIIGPFLVWMMKKDEIQDVERTGRNVLNFQITMFIFLAVSGIVALISATVGFILIAIFGTLNLAMILVASVKANNGEHFSYPFSFKILRKKTDGSEEEAPPSE